MMKMFFPETDPQKIVGSLKKALEGRELGDIVSFSLENKNITVTISKFGTTVLQFMHKGAAKGSEYELTSEKIAFTHRAFVGQVKDSFAKVVSKAGGQMTLG